RPAEHWFRAYRSEHIAVKQRVHPIWSTSFGTSTDETPFVVVELATCTNAKDVAPLHDAATIEDASVSVLSHIKAKMDMVTSLNALNALCKRGFEGRVQCMKATDNVILFCATPSQRAKSGPSKGRLLPPDEQRASDVLSFAVRATRILRAQQHASVAGGGVAVHHRVVVGSGYLMGAVVGRVGVSFDYYGSSMARALKLLELLDWGSVAATKRLVFLHRLDKAMLSTSALLSPEPFAARHVGWAPFHYHLIATNKL
ncbi:Hypothetical protein, putative, partial [Bodo saltans]